MTLPGRPDSVDHHDLAALRAGQVDQLFSHATPALCGTLAGAVILTAALWKVVPHQWLAAWFLTFMASAVIELFLISAYRRASPSPEEAVRWGRSFAVVVSCMGILWGIAGAFLFPGHSFVHQCLLGLFLACLAAGAGVSLASVTVCYVPFILLVLVPSAFRFFYEGTEIHIVIGALALIYTAALIGMVTSSHKGISESLKLRFEKDKLIDSLQQAREQLESRVAERTANLREKNEELQREIQDRNRTEEALRQSEERIRAIVEHSTNVFYAHDTDHILTYLSPQLTEVLGYRLQELLVNWQELLTDNPVNLIGVEATQRAIDTGERQPPYHLELKSKGGQKVWVEVNESPVVKDGKTVAIVGSLTDMTQRKQAEEDLIDSEERYRLLAQNSLTGIYIIQSDQFVYVNDRLAEILHYSPDEMVGKKYWDFLHPQDAGRVMDNGQARILGKGGPSQYEFRVVCKDGETKYLEAFVAVIKYRGQHAIMGNVADITKRKLAEELLKASEERYRTLFEKAGDGICILEAEGQQVARILSANKAAAEMHSYDRTEFLDLDISALVGHQQETELSDRISRLREGKWIKEEILHRKKDGTVFPVEVSAGPLQFSDRKYILAMYRDVTDRKSANEVLRKHKETLEALLNATTDMAILLDSQGTILHLNQEAASRLGGSPENLLGSNIFHYGPMPLVAQRRARLEKVVATGKPSRDVEYGRDGRFYDTSASPVFGPDGQVDGIALFARDITDDRKAEEGLRKSEKKYRKILETIAEGYHEVDLAGNFTLVNDSMCEILGYRRDELLGMNYRALMDSVNSGKVSEAHVEVCRTGMPNPDFTHQIIRKDGAKRDVSVSITLIKDSSREPSGFRGILRDMTERNLLEGQLRQAVKMEAIGRMAGGVAHDFNNLLTAIMGYSDILARQMPPGGPQHKKILQISRASVRGAELTKQLLAFSRKQMLDMRVLDLRELVSDIEDMLRRLIGEDVELSTVFDADLGHVKADPAQLGQIIMNLAVNARDAMPKGGKLAIEALNAVLDEQYARVHAEVKPGPYVMLSVTDTGQGMDAETRARAFDPFFTTKAKDFGTGLGLSTVYGIVKQHDGHITIYTEPGRGTTFKIYLPAVEGVEHKKESPAGESVVRLGGKEVILLVEDEETVRNLACEALEMLGYLVVKACTAEEAIAFSQTHKGPIDLLLTDVVLPRMDGKSLFAALSHARPGLRVLYVSGYTENFIVHHGVLDAGVNFLQKPFTVDALAGRVRDVLDRALVTPHSP